MTYEDISRVNSEIKMLDLKGKDYAMVPERVTAFRKLYPDGIITTEIISHEDGVVLMKASVGYNEPTVNAFIVLATGYAQEVKGKGMVNGTSYIENCETSAVGRALGFLGLGLNGGGICSAEELANAITAQRQMQEEKPIRQDAPATVERAEKLPEAKKDNPEMTPAMEYLVKCMKEMKEMRQVDGKTNKAIWDAQRAELLRRNMIAKKPLIQYTMEEAMQMVDCMYRCFDPKGTELKVE